MWARRVAVAGAVVALAAWSFWHRWQLVTGSPFPVGVDGYFYPIELRSLLDRGVLSYPASPLAFYLMAPLAALTDPITGAKLGAALFGAAIAGPAYGVGARLGGGRGAGLVAAAIATTSAGSTYQTLEFVKNGVGLTVALAAIWLVLRATERPSGGRVVAAATGLVAAYTTHKMAAALVLVVAIPAALGAAAARGALRGRRLLYAIGGLVLIGGGALVAGAVFPERVLSAGDAELVRGLFSATPRWTAPALVVPGGELSFGYDALLGLVLGLVAVIAHTLDRRDRRSHRAHRAPSAPPPPPAPPTAPGRQRDLAPLAAIVAASWPIVLLAIAIGLPLLAVTDRQGLGFRLRIAAFVPAALTAAIVARFRLARLAAFVPAAIAARFRLARMPHRDAVLAAIALVLALLRQPSGSEIAGEVVTHPALVAAAQALNGQLPAGATLIVPERHIAFLVAWYTRAPVALRPDRIPPSRRVRLLPLHFIGAGSALDDALMAARAEPSLVPPIGVHPLHPNGLVLVTESTWAWVLDHLPPADRAYFSAWPTI